MAKKRPTLDTFLTSSTDTGGSSAGVSPATSRRSAGSPIEKSKEPIAKEVGKKKKEIVLQTVYLPKAVHKQLRELAFEREKKMHDILMEGLDLAFKKYGLKGFDELVQ
jgi:hypothetical protein